MSKWINKDLFNDFREEKKKEEDNQTFFGESLREKIFKIDKGTDTKPKIYEGRFLQDKNGKFYVKYYYHYVELEDGRKIYTTCPKTHGMDNYCPECSVVSLLYKGNKVDQSKASKLVRKIRYAGNFYIVDDPRDHEVEDENEKNNGKVKILEFPGKVEALVKATIVDKKNGLGERIFDPGKDGHNFVLKVASTKPDPQKRVWPDYSTSIFSRDPSPLGTDKEIEKIMSQTYDLSEYLTKDKSVNFDNMKTVLEEHMVFSMIEDEWKKFIDPELRTDENDETETFLKSSDGEVPDEDIFGPDPQDKTETETTDENELDDDELLKELEDL